MILFIVYLITLLIAVPVICVYLIHEPQNITEDIVSVYIVSENKVVQMNKEEYIFGVVAAEMPAEFEFEALKAQSVAARTYLENRINNDSIHAPEHKGAHICTDYTHCSAWISTEARMNSWEPDKADANKEKISLAVNSTSGQILTFEGEPISAVYHSTSAGRTENAADVWGNEIEYLKSVESALDTASPKFSSQKTIACKEFKKIICEKYPQADFTGELWTDIVRSDGGYVKSITVGGVELKGTQIRAMFELRSANFEISQENENITFSVKGNGHGVGMSQYGANFMAKEGKSYEDILLHYYTGVSIAKADYYSPPILF